MPRRRPREMRELVRDATEAVGWWQVHGDGAARALDRSRRIAQARDRARAARRPTEGRHNSDSRNDPARLDG